MDPEGKEVSGGDALGDPLSHILGSHGQRDGNIKRISQPPGGVSERQAGRCWSCTE